MSDERWPCRTTPFSISRGAFGDLGRKPAVFDEVDELGALFQAVKATLQRALADFHTNDMNVGVVEELFDKLFADADRALDRGSQRDKTTDEQNWNDRIKPACSDE